MADLIGTDKMAKGLTIVVGVGATGLSVARHLTRQGKRFLVTDTRTDPPMLRQLAAELPHVKVELGGLQEDTLAQAGTLVMSPGLSLEHPLLQEAIHRGVRVIGDIQLFAEAARAPVVAITGSNGKSTVTALVGEMARSAGRKAGVGGNLGTPALDLLADDIELYVVELSSFQLELVEKLNAEAATVLNLSPDHMDRYPDIQAYHRAKHRIFSGVSQVVINRSDPLSTPLVAPDVKQWTFGLDKPDFKGFGLITHRDESWLAFETTPLMPVSSVAIKGCHNVANALAALALGRCVELPMHAMLEALRQFPGLPHRCQTIGEVAGISWINDSKATNVGAAVAAIESFGTASGGLILVAGGQGKGQDFTPLGEAARERVKLMVLLGEDVARIAEKLPAGMPVIYATSMESAVNAARKAAGAGDTVLLSPACASFDMFEGFEDRGEQFRAAVEALS